MVTAAPLQWPLHALISGGSNYYVVTLIIRMVWWMISGGIVARIELSLKLKLAALVSDQWSTPTEQWWRKDA